MSVDVPNNFASNNRGEGLKDKVLQIPSRSIKRKDYLRVYCHYDRYVFGVRLLVTDQICDNLEVLSCRISLIYLSLLDFLKSLLKPLLDLKLLTLPSFLFSIYSNTVRFVSLVIPSLLHILPYFRTLS